MTLQNFIKTHTLKKRGTTKLIVRDLDEIEKNTFVAYVDENNMSYDVKLTLDTKLNVVESTCDCDQNGVCQHLVALANHLKENKKEKVVVKTVRKKKLTEIEQLIDAQDPEEVFLWLKNILNKNKEWALAFKQNFLSKNIELNEENINNTIQECFVSVVGRRKKIESNEIKKIVDAIELSLKPYLDVVYNHINLDNYLLFYKIIQLLNSYDYGYKHNSSRLETLISKIRENYFLYFLNCKDAENWQKILQSETNKIFLEKSNNIEYNFFINLYKNCKEDPIKKQFIANLFDENLKNIYLRIKADYFPFNQAIEQLIFNVINENQLFKNHYTKFKPQRYYNDYNKQLIEALISIEQYSLAQKYCEEQIQGNYKEEYNFDYYYLLKDIFNKTNNNDALTRLYLKIGLYTLDFDIYLHLKQYADVYDFQKFVIKITAKLKDSARYGNRQAFDYFYQLKKDKNKEKDILELLKYISNLDLITDYLEITTQLDASTFIKNLFIADIYSYNNSDEKLSHLVKKIIEIVPPLILEKHIKSHNNYRENEILKRLKTKLNIL